MSSGPGNQCLGEGTDPCHAELIKMPCPVLIFSQSDHLIQIDIHAQWQTMHIQISLILHKPTDLDLHCF